MVFSIRLDLAGINTGTYILCPQVHVFWDIDNKTAIWTQPEVLVANIYTGLEEIGEIAGICAYGNRHTFSWVPPVERERRKELQERSATCLCVLASLTVAGKGLAPTGHAPARSA